MRTCRFYLYLLPLLLTGCVSLPEIALEPSATAPPDCGGSWCGPLLMDEAAVPRIQVPSADFPSLRDQAKLWRRHWRGVGKDLSAREDVRRAFYAGIETYLPTKLLEQTRYDCQKALVNTPLPEHVFLLENSALAAEHAILTQRAVRVANAVAVGEMKVSGLEAAAENLQVFRKESAYLLPSKYWGPSRQERMALDATGLELLPYLKGHAVVLEFYQAPRVRRADMRENPGSIEAVLNQGAWETTGRQAFPELPDTENLTWWTQFKLDQRLPMDLAADKTCDLVLWGVGVPFKLQVNNGAAVAVKSMPSSPVQRLPLAPDCVGPDAVVSLTVTVQGRHTALPFRSAFIMTTD